MSIKYQNLQYPFYHEESSSSCKQDNIFLLLASKFEDASTESSMSELVYYYIGSRSILSIPVRSQNP